jgi:hypothetical protein|tara:strand:- start:14 stop:277 length:264 start_codon:yes stop_codon:yes gene_type:complete
MRFFFYKFLIVIVGLFILYQSTVGYTISKFQQQFYSFNIQEKSNFIKEKIRVEIKNSLKKDKVLNKKDAILIKKFFNLVSSEIKSAE